MPTRIAIKHCPCDEQRAYADCCAPLHEGAAARSAEALMRSRYSAYALRLEPYLLATWHASTRPASLSFGDETLQAPKWLGLKILRHEMAPDGDAAIVEFVARFRVGGGSAQRMREVSRFARVDGRWFYLDGDVAE
ncbi:YchJ family protein [Hydrocarboniphaga sp.]|uniref:YchJ family protein n=1 Tax=Hydrocarboniphaga sp. TaxID=2033016 RepID=UPI003D0EAB03